MCRFQLRRILEKGTNIRRNDRNKGFSLIELIIVIAIMAVLIGIVTPMFVKYVEKSRKARDLTNADRIATAINLAFTADPDAYDAFMKFGFKNDGSLDNGRAADFEVTVNGVTEKYKLIPVMVNGKEYNYRFSGTMSEFYDKNGKEGLYSFINKELGLKPTGDNGFINPKYTKTRKGKNQKGKAYNDI